MIAFKQWFSKLSEWSKKALDNFVEMRMEQVDPGASLLYSSQIEPAMYQPKPREIAMDRESYIDMLRSELVKMAAEFLTPVAVRYGYSETPLEANIKWQPQVLLIGNYSSGKSTLINDFLGARIQATGQAPTDDSFTIISFEATDDGDQAIQVVKERDGKSLLGDPEFPFESLKKYGQRFAAHFRMKKVNAPFLKNLSIVDTPGMLDSISERDRGYEYQEVIGELAQMADLVLVLFDPHKAGTVREAHTSLRDILPTRTMEDRMLFVLNRIDECSTLTDLLRVYGTLCWNLSQITGRKDIPPIYLTYSQNSAETHYDSEKSIFLSFLENQREDLKNAILRAPRYRLEHLAAFAELHAERLAHFTEALKSYHKKRLEFRARNGFHALLAGLLGTALIAAGLSAFGMLPLEPTLLLSGAGGSVALIMLFWMAFLRKYFIRLFHKTQLQKLEELTPLETQARRDSWDAVKERVHRFLEKSGGEFSARKVKRDHEEVRRVVDEFNPEIREALGRLSNTRPGEEIPFDGILFGRQVSFLEDLEHGDEQELPPPPYPYYYMW